MAYHNPVMEAELLESLAPLEDGLIVDATFGGGGHSRAILRGLPSARIVAIDRDSDVEVHVPKDPRICFVRGKFSQLIEILGCRNTNGLTADGSDSDFGGIAAVVFDLGVSSHQLDTPSRGFSFRQRGPLDMRMSSDAPLTADVIVNTWPESELERVIRSYGEEPNAVRISREIIAARPITDTIQLADVIASSVPAAVRRRRHPARRTFQAFRIAVNSELEEIQMGLDAAIEVLRPGGRIAVMAYHSLEDRIVRQRFARRTAGCDCPPDLPICVCGHTAQLRSLTSRGITPSSQEIEANPRARSARLRVVERIAP